MFGIDKKARLSNMIMNYEFIKALKNIQIYGDKIEIVPENYSLMLRTNNRCYVYRLTPYNKNMNKISEFFDDCLANDIQESFIFDPEVDENIYNIETRKDQLIEWLKGYGVKDNNLERYIDIFGGFITLGYTCIEVTPLNKLLKFIYKALLDFNDTVCNENLKFLIDYI